MAVVVANSWPGSIAVPSTGAAPPAGLSLSIPLGSTPGDWIIAVIAWRQTATGTGATVSVEDDAHNWWEPAGAPSGDSAAAGTVRTAIWYAPAARAARMVTIAPTGQVQALAALILDVNGMTPWLSLTPIVTGYANAGAALTTALGAPSAQALIIAGLGTDLNTATITGPGAGWTSLAAVTGSNLADHTSDITLNTAYQLATGATSAAWSSSASLDLAGVIGGFLVSVAAPVQPNPSWPVMVTEAAPGAGVKTPPSQLKWVDISARVRDLQITQGAPYLLGGLQAGQGQIELDNADGAAIPPGTGSLAGIDSGTPLRVRAAWPSSSTPWAVPFSGYFQQLPPGWDEGLRGQVKATITDAYGYAGRKMQSVLRTEVLNDAPYGYWPCSDAAGAGAASNLAGQTPLTLTVSKYGAGAATEAFGAAGGAIKGDSSGTMWSQSGVPAGNTVGYSLHAPDGGYPAISAGVTVEGWWQLTSTTPIQGFLLSLMSSVNNIMNIYTATTSPYIVVQTRGLNGTVSSVNVTTTTNPYNFTSPFHIAVAFDQASFTIVVNGGAVATLTGSWFAQISATFSHLWVNGNWAAFGSVGGATFNGYSGHIAVYPRKLPIARIQAHYQAGATAFAGESASWRAERLLAAAGLPGRRFVMGETTPDIDPCTSAGDWAGTTASSKLQALSASTVPAVLTTSPTGAVCYLSKQFLYNQPVRWALGDSTAGGEIPFTAERQHGYDPARVVNDIQITQADTSIVTVPSVPEAASQSQYGDQTYQATGYLQNDATSAYTAGPGLNDAANWIAEANMTPKLRIAQAVVDAARHPSAWPFVLAAAPGDMATAITRPPTGSYTVAVTGRISQVSRHLGFTGGQVSGSATVAIDGAPEENALTCDDSTRGQLNATNVLGW